MQPEKAARPNSGRLFLFSGYLILRHHPTPNLPHQPQFIPRPQPFPKRLKRHQLRAKACQMRGVLLAINQADAATRQKRHGAGKGDFGGIGAVGKHGFAVKHAADLHTIKATRQLPLPRCVGQPAFKAVRVPHAVQRGVGSLKIGCNPSAALLGAWHLGAGGNYIGKARIRANAVAFVAQGFGERTPDVQPLGQQHGAGVLRKPVKQAVGRLKTPFRPSE